jgi:outer membrane protein assembly factor BamA/autotransporter translocation and assembly factor TamB
MSLRARTHPITRRFVLATFAVVAVLAIPLLAVHLPWVQSRLSSWALSLAAARGFIVTTSAVSFNIATRSVHVEGLVVATAADPGHPFVEAARLDVTLPRSVFTGRFAVTSISGDGLRVVLLRRQDGTTNFLQNKPDDPGGSSSFPIDALNLSNVSVRWQDDVLGMSFVADSVSASLHPTDRGAGGKVAFDRPAMLRAGNHDTSVNGEMQLAWDGATLSFESLRLQAPEATLSAIGSIGVLIAAHPLAVDGSGSANLDRVVAWFTPNQRPIGRVEFKVHAAGTTADPNADVTLTSRSLAWQGLSDVSIDAPMHIDRNALDTGQFTVRGLGGTATGRGRVNFAPGVERARIAVDWQNIDAEKLLAALDQKTSVRVGALLDGKAAASWAKFSRDGLTANIESTTHTTQVGLGLGGTLTLDVRNGEWRGAIDQLVDGSVHVEGRANGRLAAASLAASTVDGTVAVTADSLPELWRTLHDLDLVPMMPPESLPGTARADLMLSGRIDNPGIAGRIDATLPTLDRVRVGASPNLQPSGVLSLSANVSGTARTPAINGQLKGEALAIAGQHADRLDAVFDLGGQTARVERLVLTQPDGRLTASGQYDVRTGAIMAVATATNLTVNPVPDTEPDKILVPVTGKLNGEVQLTGTMADPKGSGQLTLDQTRALERDIGRVSTRLTLGDHQLRAAIDLPDLATTGTMALALRQPGGFTLDTQTTDADLAMLASRLQVALSAPVTGVASFTAHAEGVRTDIAHARTTVTLQRLEALVRGIALRSTEPGRATYDGRTLDIAGVSIGIGTGGRSQLRAAGRLGNDAPGTLTASLDGQAGDLHQLALVFLPAESFVSRLQIEGRVRADLRAPGTFERPALTAEASLDDGRITVAGQPESAAVVARVAYDAGMVKLSRLDATWQAATLTATGDIPIALVAPKAPAWIDGGQRPAQTTGRLQARFDSITPAVVAPFVSAATMAQLGGLVSGTLELDADRPALAAVRGQLVLDRADLSVAGVPFTQQQPTRVDVAGGRAQIAAWNWGGAGNSFSVSGGVKFDEPQALDVAVDGTIDLRALGAFLPQVATGGEALLKARVTGAPSAPLLDGRIDLQRGELRVASPRLAISDLTGVLLLSKDEVTVRDVEAQANGGTLSVGGALKHSGLNLTGGRVDITGRNLAMAIPQDLKTEVSLDLVLTADRGALMLSGDASVLGGAYREPISLATGFLQAIESSSTTIQLDEPSAAEKLALNIRLTTSEDIIVDNNYARLALAADVRIVGTLAAPSLIGHSEAREGGQIFLGGNVYQIEGAGAIDFANPARIEPDLRITAKTRVAGHDITMTLKGPPSRLETNLKSDQLSEGEIVSLLVTGSTQDTGAMSITSDQVIGLLSGEVLGVTGRALGLDALRVERGQDVRFDAGLVAGDTDPSSRLTFGKQVTRTVELVFSQSLKDSGKLTWIIGYRPKSNVELRFVSRDNEARIYDFRHDVIIGGDPAAKVVAAGRTPSKVASVRFTGTPGVSEATLRERLKLTEGDTFDFFRWQDDRDRLEESLKKSGRLEARVSARRSGSPSDGLAAVALAEAAVATVELTYDVYQGPRTVVDISGIPANDSLREEIERLWSEAVFDGFLLDEAKSAARAVVVRDGYLAAMVTASISQPEGAQDKHLIVSIQPGMRYAKRKLAFTGQQHVSAKRLEEVAGAVTSPWVDSAPLMRAITTMYRNEGYLDAGVSVNPPQFSGDTATLPVVIREGPLFRLESVEFVGASARTPDQAAKAFALKPGASLTRAAADDAVKALTGSYRTEGFNSVRVTLTNQAARATGLVALTVNVDEGPRQVVNDIRIEGTRRTSPSLVSRELKLKVGQPVDLTAWAQARKRLFDTGIFRQVDIQAVPVEVPSPLAGVLAEVEPLPAEQPVTAHVTLEEFPPLRVRYGFELEDEIRPASEARILRPGLAADATYRNVFGRAATTGLALRYTKGFEAGRFFFQTPSFFRLPLTSSVFLQRSREHIGVDTDVSAIVVDLTTLTAEQRFRAWRRLQMSYAFSFERNARVNLKADPEDPLQVGVPPFNVVRLTTTALLDTRNDLVDATRGLFMSSTFEYGPEVFGSSLRFAKYFFQQNYYRTLGGKVVFATSGRFGVGAGYGQDLAVTEKFLAGGGNSVRGYDQDGLGPVDFFGNPLGGNSLLIFNEELRFPMFWRFRGVGFFDAGNVFEKAGDLRLGGLRAGTGVGLRVVTPFALLRVDVGTPIRPRPGEERVKWFFSIGQSF